jgi:hypothetical protein
MAHHRLPFGMACYQQAAPEEYPIPADFTGKVNILFGRGNCAAQAYEDGRRTALGHPPFTDKEKKGIFLDGTSGEYGNQGDARAVQYEKFMVSNAALLDSFFTKQYLRAFDDRIEKVTGAIQEDKTKQKMKRTKRLATMALIPALALLPSCNRELNFDRTKWNVQSDPAFPPEYRKQMLTDLTTHYPLKGMRYPALVQLLGEPDVSDSSGVGYKIVTQYGHDIDPIYTKNLEFTFSKDSVVRSFQVLEWGHR